MKWQITILIAVAMACGAAVLIKDRNATPILASPVKEDSIAVRLYKEETLNLLREHRAAFREAESFFADTGSLARMSAVSNETRAQQKKADDTIQSPPASTEMDTALLSAMRERSHELRVLWLDMAGAILKRGRGND